MKKILFFLTVAALAAVACNKSETVRVDDSAMSQISLRTFAAQPTKGAELDGEILRDGYSIYAAATQKGANGVIENASFFAGTEQLFENKDADVTADTKWQAYGASDWAPVYWPMGGDARLDFLAYATEHHSATDGEWKVIWDNPATDVASMFHVADVDTYANQDDFVYAAVQNQSKDVNGGDGKSVRLNFKHAQALLIFNVKANAAAAGMKINEIMFIDDTRLQQLREYAQGEQAYAPLHAAWEAKKAADNYDSMSEGDKTAWDAANPEPTAPVLADIADNQVTLKTIGTFTVDNRRVELIADWSDLASDADNYAMPGSVTAMSDANSEADDSKVFDYGVALTAESNFHQLGETLLIPEQEKVCFVIKYTVGDKTMYYKYNDLRGIWSKGAKYIYNLDINLEEIVITESVADFVSNPIPVAL